ncbi:MAG: hypothetical protein RLZZ255_1847 [Cyanobacteriota bacterium]|jgi:hypothetical protein
MGIRAVLFTMALDPAADKRIWVLKKPPLGAALKSVESRENQAQPFWLMDST